MDDYKFFKFNILYVNFIILCNIIYYIIREEHDEKKFLIILL